VERLLHLNLGDPLYALEDEKTSVKLNNWLKAQVFRGFALGSGLAR